LYRYNGLILDVGFMQAQIYSRGLLKATISKALNQEYDIYPTHLKAVGFCCQQWDICASIL